METETDPKSFSLDLFESTDQVLSVVDYKKKGRNFEVTLELPSIDNTSTEFSSSSTHSTPDSVGEFLEEEMYGSTGCSVSYCSSIGSIDREALLRMRRNSMPQSLSVEESSKLNAMSGPSSFKEEVLLRRERSVENLEEEDFLRTQSLQNVQGAVSKLWKEEFAKLQRQHSSRVCAFGDCHNDLQLESDNVVKKVSGLYRNARSNVTLEPNKVTYFEFFVLSGSEEEIRKGISFAVGISGKEFPLDKLLGSVVPQKEKQVVENVGIRIDSGGPSAQLILNNEFEELVPEGGTQLQVSVGSSIGCLALLEEAGEEYQDCGTDDRVFFLKLRVFVNGIELVRQNPSETRVPVMKKEEDYVSDSSDSAENDPFSPWLCMIPIILYGEDSETNPETAKLEMELYKHCPKHLRMCKKWKKIVEKQKIVWKKRMAAEGVGRCFYPTVSLHSKDLEIRSAFKRKEIFCFPSWLERVVETSRTNIYSLDGHRLVRSVRYKGVEDKSHAGFSDEDAEM